MIILAARRRLVIANVLITGCSSSSGLLAALRFARTERFADIIYAAVQDATPKLRYLAGGDATMITTAYKQMDFEQHEQMMSQSLDRYH